MAGVARANAKKLSLMNSLQWPIKKSTQFIKQSYLVTLVLGTYMY